MNNSLTSFRFFAFFAVFLFHHSIFPIGYLGVQAFFVLSGFLITAILVKNKKRQSPFGYFYSFYGRRALRIFPVYYFYLAAIFILAASAYFPEMRSEHKAINQFYKQIIWALTYTYNFFHASDGFRHTHFLSHFWSLAIEEQFYLFWPIVLFFIPAHRTKLFLLIMVVLGPLVRWWTGELVRTDAIGWLGNNTGLIVYVSPFSYIDAFAMGGFFALYGRGTSFKTIWALFVFILLFGLWVNHLFAGNIDWFGSGYGGYMERAYGYVWGYSLFNLFFALCLVSLRDNSKAGGFMSSPVLVYLGSISYGMYIFHNAFIWSIQTYLPDLQMLLKILLAFICTVAISAASYKWLETPCLNLKDKWFPVR